MQPALRRRRTLLALTLLMLLGSVAWVLWRIPALPIPPTAAWKPQPDQIPFGTLVQGSQVEFSAAMFSGRKPSPPPAFLGSLPPVVGRVLETGYRRFQESSAKSGWRVAVTAPPWVILDRPSLEFHSVHGAYVALHGRLKTDRPGEHAGSIQLTVRGRGTITQGITLPLRIRVVAPEAGATVRRVLVTTTPYDLYSTDDGRRFEPLGRILDGLSRRNLQVDLLEQLPKSLTGYSLVLLAGEKLVELSPAQAQSVREHVAGGGTLVLAADAFFVGTAPAANTMATPHGLTMETRDAGGDCTNLVVRSDALTAGIGRLYFHRPARIHANEAAGARLLVQEQDGEGGFAAVSRAPGRGEIRLLASSLWWNWVGGEGTNTDNGRLLERLLTP